MYQKNLKDSERILKIQKESKRFKKIPKESKRFQEILKIFQKISKIAWAPKNTMKCYNCHHITRGLVLGDLLRM